MLGRFVGLGAVLVVLLALPGSAAGQAATGDLVIQKIAPQGSTNTYTFTVNPGGTVLQTTGSGTTAATPLAPGTDYSITESDIPALEEVSLMRCRVTGGPFTGTWESGTSTISGIEIVAGATTKCDVFNDPRRLLLETTNDGNGDGTFTKDETVPTGATFPRTVTFRAVMTNTTSSNTDFLTITNDAAADPLQTAGPGLDCADVDGVPAKSTVTCFYDRSFGATGPPAETDTLAVAGSVFSEVEFRATDSSIVRFGPSLAITKTPSAQSVPAGSPLGFGIVVANAGRAASGPVTLTDPLPANPGLSWSVSPAVAGCSITAGTLTCDLGPLAVGASAQINVTSTTTRAACGPVTNTAAATADGVTVSSTAMSAVQCFGVTLDKQGPPVAHHGDSLRYTFAVANAGGLGVDGVVVSDDKCAVGATPVERRNDDGDGLLETPGTDGQTSEVWVYACTTTAPAHAAGETLPLHNVATVNGSAGGNAVTAIDSYDTQIIHPAVNIVDQGPARATAGTLLQYVLTVTNPGDVALTGNTVAVTDADCDAAPALRDKGGDASSDALNPGDTWTYTCSHATTARRAGRQAQTVPNRATVAGTDPLGARVTDDDAVETALETVPAPDPDPTPDGGVRGNRERSGSARLRGPARCVRNAFAVRIRGRRMRTVTVTIDGRRVRAFASPGRTVAYRVRTGRYAPGVHRLRARVAFARASDTAPRTLRFAFQRCRERVVPAAVHRMNRWLGAVAVAGVLAAPAAAADPLRPVRASGPLGDERLSNETTLTRLVRPYARASVHVLPAEDARVVDRLHFETEDSAPEIYVALASTVRDGRTWIRLRLPGRPNGRTGWVHRDVVSHFIVRRTELVVSRARLRATLYRGGKEIWSSPVGIGAPGTPTPTGHFWIRERLRGDFGTYGPWAFGTAAYSVLSEWPGGGVIGIHGTNAPGLIPGRPSHGCVRVPNSAILRLARLMPVGTPVRIR